MARDTSVIRNDDAGERVLSAVRLGPWLLGARLSAIE
jgi:hypothetical protein